MSPLHWPFSKPAFLSAVDRLHAANDSHQVDVSSSDFDEVNYAMALLSLFKINWTTWAAGHSHGRDDDDFDNTLSRWVFKYHSGRPLRGIADSDSRKWLTLERFLEAGVALDEEHGRGRDDVEYDPSSLFFRILDEMVFEIRSEVVDPLTWALPRLPANLRTALFVKRLANWPSTHENDGLEARNDLLAGFAWPQDYHGPRSFDAAFLVVAHAAHMELVQRTRGAACQQLLVFLRHTVLRRLPWSLAHWLEALEDHFSPLGISVSVLDAPGVFRVLLENQPSLDAPSADDVFEAVCRSYDSLVRTRLAPWEIEGFVAQLHAPRLEELVLHRRSCPVCWEAFEAPVSPRCRAPRTIPCCGMQIGKACLVQTMKGRGMWCSWCRQDMRGET